MGNKKEIRMIDRIALISAVVLILGGGGLGIFSLGYIIDFFVPGFMEGRSNAIYFVPFLIVLFLALGIGMFIGAVVWMLCMKPFLKRREILPFLTGPYFPVITPALTRTFDFLYPPISTEDKKS
jgi:hypothetical protein